MIVGLSTCSKIINEDFFQSLQNNNISAIEISVSHEDYPSLDYSFIKRMSDVYGIDLWSYHLPFSPFSEIDISKRELKKKTINYFKVLIEKAAEIGIRRFVVHPSGEPILDRYRRNRMEYAKESLYELAEFTSTLDSFVLCENLPRTCLGRNSEEILGLIGVDDRLKVVFDTNHLLCEAYSDFIDKTGNRIESVHISDYDYLNERHWLPGEGKIDWYDLYTRLINSGYKGPWLYEIGFDAPGSIRRPRTLTCNDFSRNASEIFERREITVISEPVYGLTGWK